MTEQAPVDLWRCSRCGKWSHAKRRPKHHERTVGEAEAGDTLLRTESGMDGFDGWWSADVIACGPFERWIAVRRDEP